MCLTCLKCKIGVEVKRTEVVITSRRAAMRDEVELSLAFLAHFPIMEGG